MILNLSEAESDALLRALEGYLPTLAAEASRADRVADAHEIWESYRRLEAVLGRLRAGSAAIETSAPAPDFP